MSLGFEQAGFDIVFAADRDGYHVATHKRNFPYGVSVCRDVGALTGTEIREAIGHDGEIDLLFGGPPCQGFSHMGLRDIDDPRNTLVDEYARIVGELRPRAFVIENVPGMQSGRTGEIFERVIKTLESHGYNITWPVRILSAQDFGVPQKRTRLFILGLSEDAGDSIPYPAGPVAGQAPRPTVAGALEGLPVVERFEHLFKEELAPYDDEAPPEGLYARVARGLEDDPSDLSRPRVWDRSSVSGCQRTRHSDTAVALYAATPPGAMVPGHKLPRLDPAGIAPTLRAGSESERGSHTAPRPVHPDLPRVITVREAARLHGFPDWFSFYPGKFHAYRQIGNAVCPPMARAVGREILRVLGYAPAHGAPEPMELEYRFDLPEDRPRHQRRIVQLDEFPKVVDHLFKKAYNKKKRVLTRGEFDVEDIRVAIVATDANMPRTRPERFLDDLARSRNVAKLVAGPAAHGFTIRAIGNGTGTFVPLGTPGSVDDRDSVAVSSDQVAHASDLPMATNLPATPSELAALVERPDVARTLWKMSKRVPELERGLFGIPDGRLVRYVIGNGAAPRIGCVIVEEGANVSPKSRILRIMRREGATEAVVLALLTREHVFAARFHISDGGVTEAARRVYRMTTPSQ